MAVANTLDLVGLGLATAAGACAWRSLRFLSRTAIALRGAPEIVVGSESRGGVVVSLLVPARNEQENIEECVRGLVQQGAGTEVLVLDDSSEDETAARARAVIAEHAAHAAVIAGRPLEPGWTGKSFACQQLAEAAQGKWLLFVDADVRMRAGGVARALRQVTSLGADFASFFPRYTGHHWGNRLVVPWLYYFLCALLPVPEVLRVRHPRLGVAIGQAILVQRDAYWRMGGHAVVRDRVIEDVSLGIEAKRAGLRVALLDGRSWLECRMYAGTRGLVEGFAKNFHSAAALHPFQWLGMMALLALVGLRPWWRAMTLPLGEAAVPIATITVVTSTFAVLLAYFRQRFEAALFWPCSLSLLVVISLVAGTLARLGRPVPWRGRLVGGRAPSARRPSSSQATFGG